MQTYWTHALRSFRTPQELMQGTPPFPLPQGTPGWLKAAIVIALTLLAKGVFDRLKRRSTTLTWTAEYQPMAFATTDFGWGRVEILYDGEATQNLHIAQITLQNDTSRDLAGLRVLLSASEGSRVLRSAGALTGGEQRFDFTAQYSEALVRDGNSELTPAEIGYWQRRTGFEVPVLNRSSSAGFRLLLSRNDYATPSVDVTCEMLGVRLVHSPPAAQLWGVKQAWAAWTGIVFSLFVGFVAYRLGWAPMLPMLIAWLIGLFAAHIGAAFLRLWRWFLNQLP